MQVRILIIDEHSLVVFSRLSKIDVSCKLIYILQTEL